VVARIVVKVAIRNVRGLRRAGHHAAPRQAPLRSGKRTGQYEGHLAARARAGHDIGDMPHEGTETKLLMRGEGSGYQIPFKLAKRFRDPS
jgi:hypothetical protein